MVVVSSSRVAAACEADAVDVLSRLEPGAVEHRLVGARGRDDDVHARHRVPGRLDGHNGEPSFVVISAANVRALGVLLS